MHGSRTGSADRDSADTGSAGKASVGGDSSLHSAAAARIRCGVGGWSFDEWRGSFYPRGLPASRQLDYMGARLNTTEINATFYRLQSPRLFAQWRDQVPEDFLFAVKGPRLVTHRRVLRESAEALRAFLHSGIAELGSKLGPILWQFAPTKRYDAQDMEGFADLLPSDLDGLPLRHVFDVRHHSFMCRDYLDFARSRKLATVFTVSDHYPSFANVTGPFVYARLMNMDASLASGFREDQIDGLAKCAQVWKEGGEPGGVPCIDPGDQVAGNGGGGNEATGVGSGGGTNSAPRDVFLFFINGAKERAPAAAMALRERLRRMP